MRSRPALLLVLLLAACPARKQPERGVELVFAKQGAVRQSVERRLAGLGVRARLTEDGDTLTVRFPDSGAPLDLPGVKALLSLPARLEFCPQATAPPDAACEPRPLVDGGTGEAEVSSVRDELDGRACVVVGPDAEAVRAATPAGPGQRALVGPTADGAFRGYVAEAGCLSPHVLKAEPSTASTVPMVVVTFDGPTAARFSDLTAALVKRRLLVVLDDVVTSAPLVEEAITGGRAMVTAGAIPTRPLAIALEAGPIPGGLTLVREGPYGPPRLSP